MGGVRRIVKVEKCADVDVELVWKLEMTAVPSRAGVFEILGVESTLAELVKTEGSTLNFTSLAFSEPTRNNNNNTR